jgi:hypothetical protein
MITVYHGARPLLPLMACARHIGLETEDGFSRQGTLPDWRINPLFPAGLDSAGNTVYCLVHGRHRGLYLRALEGTAALFGLAPRFVDVDRFILAQAGQNVKLLPAALIARYVPALLLPAWRRQLNKIFLTKLNY